MRNNLPFLLLDYRLWLLFRPCLVTSGMQPWSWAIARWQLQAVYVQDRQWHRVQGVSGFEASNSGWPVYRLQRRLHSHRWNLYSLALRQRCSLWLDHFEGRWIRYDNRVRIAMRMCTGRIIRISDCSCYTVPLEKKQPGARGHSHMPPGIVLESAEQCSKPVGWS